MYQEASKLSQLMNYNALLKLAIAESEEQEKRRQSLYREATRLANILPYKTMLELAKAESEQSAKRNSKKMTNSKNSSKIKVMNNNALLKLAIAESEQSAKRNSKKMTNSKNSSKKLANSKNSSKNSTKKLVNSSKKLASKNSTSKNSKESNRYKRIQGKLVPIGYTLRNVPGDGDCLYHAVSRAIGATITNNKFQKNVPNTAHFRNELWHFIEESTRSNRDKFDRAALRRIRSGGWGEDYEVQKIVDMISKKYGINFCICMFNAKNELRSNSHRWQLFSQQYSGECDHMIYLHNSGNSRGSEHFQYMMPSVYNAS